MLYRSAINAALTLAIVLSAQPGHAAKPRAPADSKIDRGGSRIRLIDFQESEIPFEEGPPLVPDSITPKEIPPDDQAIIPPSPGATPNLLDTLLVPQQSEVPAHRIAPPAVDYSYNRMSDGAYDLIGSFQGGETLAPDRPTYPYNAQEYWYGHDADVEQWGDLLEAPYVQLGWFANVDATVFSARVDPEFNSGDFLQAAFPNDPVTLGAAKLHYNVMPHVEVGYRFEHGLGELRAGFRYFQANGNDALSGFDSAGRGSLRTTVQASILDLDYSILEFNAESFPWIPTLMKDPGRLGLGRPVVPSYLVPPLEIRWTFGARLGSFSYFSEGSGDLKRESVANDFSGAGLHFALELNQRLPFETPIFIHGRAEGSGMFGTLSQEFSRSVAGPAPVSARQGFGGDSTGIPTANVELGISWAPQWPTRNLRFTAAYQFEEWFSLGQAQASNMNFLMNGLLLRCESKF